MTDPVTIEIHGLREIQDKIRQLPANIGRRVVYGALRKGAAVVRKEARKNVPVRTGALRKGFKVSRSKIHRSASEFGVYLTLKKGRGRHDPADPFYGRWVEAGWKRGNNQIPGVYFMRRAFEAKAQEAVNVIVAEADAKTQQLIRDMGL
jgi:HK97 gp10 family phage protein